jgi:hypothetical protein
MILKPYPDWNGTTFAKARITITNHPKLKGARYELRKEEKRDDEKTVNTKVTYLLPKMV